LPPRMAVLPAQVLLLLLLLAQEEQKLPCPQHHQRHH